MNCGTLRATKQVSHSDVFGNALLRWAFGAPTQLFRWHLGWVLDHRFLSLAHTGRRTGAVHHVVLEVVYREHQRDTYVVVAGFGEKADWLRNVEANGRAEVSIGRTRFIATARRLEEPEAATVLAGYEQDHPVLRPAVRWLLSRLLGWEYDGLPASRRRAVRQLPFVEFSPAVDPGRVPEPPASMRRTR